MGKGSRMSLTDLHKGTHNCAAAIRESGAGISPSTPSLSLPAVAAATADPFAPVSPGSPFVVHPRRPPSFPLSPTPLCPAERGDGARALSQCAAIIFPHEWAAVSVVPGLVLRCSRCIFSPPHPSCPLLMICPSVSSLSPAAFLGYIREKKATS